MSTDGGAFAAELARARGPAPTAAVIAVGRAGVLARLTAIAATRVGDGADRRAAVPDTPFLLDPLTRIGVKMLLNALSTCTMVRLGRVLGNR